ncbi:MAG: 3-hydroxyacyl-CoA dehydrogenase [Betaproteobacteria bacterium RIFCSPLOWO2_02_64_14]|nr:MAG: 3-hydroxyacyl-CoA dehydrogenase [Betaproteobacteria bacterium RIFCSPLOWO2_02_64_14]
MTLDAMRPDLLTGVVGAGAMGRGIVQVAAAGGINVLMTDSRPGAAQEARDFIEKMLTRASEKGTMTREDVAAAMARIKIVDGTADFKPCHVVIEAIVENLDAKREMFTQLEEIVSPDCILVTNTSSLSVTTIAAKLARPQRFAGFHFFNPVPLMKLVEVISGLLTEDWVCDTMMVIGRRMTREPVRLTDAPGFLVNQVGRGFTLEASHLVYEGIASFADVDRVMRDVGGFRMGPFELMELTGLDVTQPASELIYNQFFQEPRYRPNLIMRARYEAGVLGRKSRKGFYNYDADMKAIVPPEPPAPAAYPGHVWVSPAEPHGHAVLTELLRKMSASIESGPKPSASALILVTPLGDDATTCAVTQELDPKRTVAVDTLFPMVKRRTMMCTPLTDHVYRNAAHGLLASDGVPVTVCRDSPGFIAQRIVAMIVNIGCSIAQSRTAQPPDIDKAVTLGLNYPNGPFKFGDVLGPVRIHRVLESMLRIYGDPRYRPNIWLTRRARLGVSLLTPEP